MKKNKELAICFKDYLTGCGFKKDTIRMNIYVVNKFMEFIKKNMVEVVENDILEFHKKLSKEEVRGCIKYSLASIRMMMLCLNRFFRFLYRYEYILRNPMINYIIKKGIEKKKEIFSVDEINSFLNMISIDTIYGERDRAYFELMYSSGLRVGEELSLNITDINLSERVVAIRQGKFNKDRIVPFSSVAFEFLKIYIENGRKELLKTVNGEDNKALFISNQGRLKPVSIRLRFRKYLNGCGIEREGLSLHSIRHSTATHLLECGASVRYVQELLGHEDIQTTVRYTHLMIENLKKAYKQTHPRENKYYEEVTEEYLNFLELLKEEIKKREEINRRYPPSKYNEKRKLKKKN